MQSLDPGPPVLAVLLSKPGPSPPAAVPGPPAMAALPPAPSLPAGFRFALHATEAWAMIIEPSAARRYLTMPVAGGRRTKSPYEPEAARGTARNALRMK